MATQEVSVSELIDHGSISFGRFASESLAWEKWSVFSHNRCQEELEKFKAPGLVAQKKAYFEEYYKKIKAMKKLQAEQQETNQSDLCRDGECITLQVDTKSKEEKNQDEASQIKSLEAETITYHDSSRKTTEDKSVVTEQWTKNNNDNVSMRDEINISSSTTEPEHSTSEASPKPTSSTCSTASQQDNVVSNTVKLNANKLKDHAPLLKAKGTVASARSKTKLDGRTKEVASKPCEKEKGPLHKDTSLSERSTPRAVRNRKVENGSSHRNPIEGRLSVTLLQTSVLKDKPASSSSSVNSSLPKANLNLKGSMNKSTSKQVTVAGGVKNVDPGKRTCAGVAKKSLESNSRLMIPKRGQSENQKPKVMSTNLPARNQSIRNLGNEFGFRNDVRGGNQGKGISAPPRRVPNAASATPSGSRKAPNPKLEHKKIVPLPSADLAHARREPRHKMPSWW